MKHLKVFESFEKKLYVECAEKDFCDAMMLDMGDSVFEAISKVTNSLKVKITHRKRYFKIYGSDIDRSKLTIFMTEDEWFYAQLDKNISSAKYYKCDAVEGVLQLLKDIFDK